MIVNWGDIPGSYQESGYADDMVIFKDITDHYVLRMQTNFLAPLTGYVFVKKRFI